jgi:hypothetical protein
MHQRIGYNICVIRIRATNGPQLRSLIEQLIHHETRGEKKFVKTYSFLGNFSYIAGNADALWMFLQELLCSIGIHIVHEERVFSWYLRSEVLCHRIAY